MDVHAAFLGTACTAKAPLVTELSSSQCGYREFSVGGLGGLEKMEGKSEVEVGNQMSGTMALPPKKTATNGQSNSTQSTDFLYPIYFSHLPASAY